MELLDYLLWKVYDPVLVRFPYQMYPPVVSEFGVSVVSEFGVSVVSEFGVSVVSEFGVSVISVLAGASSLKKRQTAVN